MLEKNIVSKGNSKIEVNVTSLNDGVYLLIARDSDNNLVKTEKVIINSVK